MDGLLDCLMTIDDDLPFRVGADEREGTVSLKAD